MREVLVSHLRAATVVVGSNFRFGHRARGDVELLRQRGQQDGFAVEPIDLVEGMSSTIIRDLLAAGDVEAAACTRRPYRIQGEGGPGRRPRQSQAIPRLTCNRRLAAPFRLTGSTPES